MKEPFSNYTEFEGWKVNNCEECVMYEDKSTKRSQAKCKKAFDLDLASVSNGEITEETYDWIGLPDNCRFKNIIWKKLTINRDSLRQLKLF